MSKSLMDFTQQVQQKIQQIFQEEQSTIAIHTDNQELQDLLESYDEDFSKPYVDILCKEIELFHNQNS